MGCYCDKRPKYADPAQQRKERYITLNSGGNRQAKIDFGNYLDSDVETATSAGFPVEKDYSDYRKLRIADGGYITVKIHTDYSMGENLIAFTEPQRRYIGIKASVKGDLFSEAELHEITHIRHPDASEQSVRDIVRGMMPKAKG